MAAANGRQATALQEPARTSDALELGGIAELLGFHVRMAHAAIYRDFLTAVRECDLTQKQFAVLSLIDTNPGSSQIALANTLGADRATMMAIIDRLQARALLTRSPSRIDRRRQEIHLTPEGEAMLATAQALVRAHEAKFKQRFSPKELAALVQMLQRIGSLD